MDAYTLYVSDVSYYSGKLEAFLRYRGIPHRRVEVGVRTLREVILPATGFIKVPCMQCPDGRWLKDTTPMMAWLDAVHGGPSIYPPDPATRWIAELVEDYADEWLWRPAMHYRWSYTDSHRLLRRRLGRELSRGSAYPAGLMGWYMRWRQYFVFVRGDGLRHHNRAHVESIYHDTLRQLTALLAHRPFLLGARPSIVDYGFFASMFRHFALDPASARVMVDTAPAVYAWVARLWSARANAQCEAVSGAPLDTFTDPAWAPLFEQIARQYLPYLDANASAWRDGLKRFNHQTDGVRYPRLPVIRYRVACRERLLTRFATLPDPAREQLQSRFAASGIARWLCEATPIAAGLDREFEMPLQQHYRPARGWYGVRLLAGTPWDLPSPPVDRR